MPGGASSSDGEVFAGVRFVLFGFDSVSEVQYRSELIRGGGVDVGRYDPSCTHVIVSGRVYDDPVCVAARNDSKMVVTELWIEDSVDFGAVADANKILYRPVRDLNGIPGSGSLFICLTGYQRQERDTIMKMVNLMGAHFSKPLIAAKVTHLICYKFEGEKYELAKRVNIKLVNHRWLEDCLKAWEILPVDDYGRSGWELEIMEAEARDSDEETEEDSNVKQLAQGNFTDCLPRIMPMSTISKASSPAVGTLTIQQEVSPPNKIPHHKFEDAHMVNQFLSSPCKESMSIRTSDDNCKVLGEFSNKTNMGVRNSYMRETDHNEAPVVPENVVNLNKQNNRFTPDSAGKTITRSDAVEDRFGSLGYSQKKPRTSLSTEDVWTRIDSFHEKLQGNDVSMLALKQDTNNFAFAAIQSPAAFANLNCKEGPSGTSPLKTKIAVPRFDSLSPKSGYGNLKASTPRNSLGASRSGQFTSFLSNNAPQDKPGCPLADERSPSDVTVLTSPMVHQDQSSSKSNSATLKQKAMKRNYTSRANATAFSSDIQVTNLFCNSASMRQQDNQESTSGDQHGLETGVSDGTLSPIGNKLNIFQDCNPVVSPSCKISTSNDVNSLSPLSTNGQDADDMSLKCETLKTTLLKESAESLQPDKLGVSVTRLSNIQSGTRQNEKPTNKRSSHCAGMRISPNAADSCIHPNSSAKTLTKKAIANRKLGCKLKTSIASNTEGTACSNDSVKVKNRNPEDENSVRNTEIVATLSKDAVTEDLVKGCNSVYKDNKESVGVSMDFHLTEKAIESSPKPVEVKDLMLQEAVDDRKSESDKSVSIDVAMQQKVKKAHKALKRNSTKNVNAAKTQTSSDAEKENKPEENVSARVKSGKHGCLDMRVKDGETLGPKCKIIDEITSNPQQSHQLQKIISEPAWFIVSGHRWQRKDYQLIIKRLRGRLCNDSHHWSYKATHFIVPEPVRRTEKFFAAAASGRWILKTDYLTASKEAGKFLEEEPFECHKNGFTEDGAISLEAPRKWRRLRERTGHGAFYGMRIITYGESILPPMDTLKRVVKAGDGTILATSPPYTRFLKSGVDFAVIGAGMPHVDSWIQQFMGHEIPCILADYLVEYVCKPGFPLDKHVLYKTHACAEKSFANLLKRSEEIVTADDSRTSSEDPDDLSCSVCGSRDRGEVMLVCGDESGFRGCGIGTHIDCCDPPLDAVPEEDWFCADCTETRARKVPVKGRRKR
ncbi:hypothetical protein Taro_017336 [Colocasia esculenta]|uniref:BRCT domain-containing protein n=1 Tax=Colocasia esculenta TaxID=4460 RepID=A0A843UR42_COLES|nr:hypothetical protein [Colocasia esculenta]